MKLRLLDLLLLAAIAVGGFFAWRSGRERSRLAERYDRMSRSTGGTLTFPDRSKVYVQALRTGEPLHFAWHFYFPPNSARTLWSRGGGMSRMGSDLSGEHIGRVRIREGEGGLLFLYERFGGGSSMSQMGDRALANFLRGREDQVVVEQLGANGPVELGSRESATFLRLTLSEALQREAREKLSPEAQEQLIPVLFEMGVGVPPGELPPPNPPGE